MKIAFYIMVLVNIALCNVFDIKVDSAITDFEMCSIPMTRDSGLIYIGGVLNAKDYYEATDVLIPKVVYSSNGTSFMYKYTLPLNMPTNDSVMNILGFDYFLKWKGDSRSMYMQIMGNNVVFIDTEFVDKHCK